MNTYEKDFINTLEQHQKIVHKVCMLYTQTENDHQDLFQEILLQLWKAFPKFRGESKITTWIYKIALYTALGSLKKEKRKQKAVEDYKNIMIDASSNDQVDDRLEALQQVINKLAQMEKAIIMLYLEEKSYKEISEIMGITENNVGVKINRIKKKIKEELKVQPWNGSN